MAARRSAPPRIPSRSCVQAHMRMRSPLRMTRDRRLDQAKRLGRSTQLKYILGFVGAIGCTIFLMIYAVVAVDDFNPLGLIVIGATGVAGSCAGFFVTRRMFRRLDEKLLRDKKEGLQ